MSKSTIFVGLNHWSDQKYSEGIYHHLSPLRRNGQCVIQWPCVSSSNVALIKSFLDDIRSADIVVCLLSASLVASDDCWGITNYAIQCCARVNARFLPILVRRFYYEGLIFEKLQFLPCNQRPLKNWKDREQAYTEITRAIHKIITDKTPVNAPR